MIVVLNSGSTYNMFISGEYVRLCNPDGNEQMYWHYDEWQNDPILVMGAIINMASGLRIELRDKKE